MILYHGTNECFEEIDLSRGSKYKDFGQGFYLTPDLSTAKRMAKKRIANDGVAYLLGRYHEGTKNIAELAIELQDKYLDQQYFFGTERALSYLKRIKVVEL